MEHHVLYRNIWSILLKDWKFSRVVTSIEFPTENVCLQQNQDKGLIVPNYILIILGFLRFEWEMEQQHI